MKGTNLAARVATCAQIKVDFVLPVGTHGDGIDGAVLGANCAARAVFQDAIFDKRSAFARGTKALYMSFIFVAKIAESSKDGIRRGFSKTAEAASTNLPSEPLKLGQILSAAFSEAEAVENVQHAARANPAEGALTAGLVLSEL